MKRIAAAIALTALLLAAAPAAAKPKPLYYDGKTVNGNSLSLTLKGKTVTDIDGFIPATCVPTHGTPMTYSSDFKPPGGYKLGTTRKSKGTEYMSYKGDVTKNYTVSIKKVKGRVWKADLSFNFSYEEVMPGSFGELEQKFYVCQGDDAFLFKV